jgi:hypothetical protein
MSKNDTHSFQLLETPIIHSTESTQPERRPLLDTNPESPHRGPILVAIVLSVIFISVAIGLLNQNNSNNTGYRPASTEDKLRRIYQSQGIPHDDRMIREDAKAVEQLHREFGN